MFSTGRLTQAPLPCVHLRPGNTPYNHLQPLDLMLYCSACVFQAFKHIHFATAGCICSCSYSMAAFQLSLFFSLFSYLENIYIVYLNELTSLFLSHVIDLGSVYFGPNSYECISAIFFYFLA